MSALADTAGAPPANGTATITLSGPQVIEHNDPDAAGFTEGYWWRLDLDGHPETAEVESGAPTRGAAIDAARGKALRLGFTEDQIVIAE